jgi:hypothetical protein
LQELVLWGTEEQTTVLISTHGGLFGDVGQVAAVDEVPPLLSTLNGREAVCMGMEEVVLEVGHPLADFSTEKTSEKESRKRKPRRPLMIQVRRTQGEWQERRSKLSRTRAPAVKLAKAEILETEAVFDIQALRSWDRAPESSGRG